MRSKLARLFLIMGLFAGIVGSMKVFEAAINLVPKILANTFLKGGMFACFLALVCYLIPALLTGLLFMVNFPDRWRLYVEASRKKYK